MKTKMVVMSIALVGLMIAGQVLAGSLEPSAAPGPTMKTLDEVEPRIPIPGSNSPVGVFNITAPGSYYLTGDRIASAGGIAVLDYNVTIDLAGFALIGSNSGSYSGISLGIANGFNVEIRNGTVRNFGGSGIYEFHSAGENHRVIDVRVVNNGSSGIYLNGHGHLVKDCTVSGNGTSSASIVYGIYTGFGCTITGNSVHDNGYQANNNVTGIWTDKGCTVTGNTSRDNGDSAKGNAGITYGIVVADGCTVTGNTSYGNGTSSVGGGFGIFLTGYSLVDQNTAYSNTINMNSCATCTFGINQTL